jgi:hypothetical protein
MYNVGFGDAFLLFIPTSDGPRTVLVDCGVHPNGVKNPMKKVVADILASVPGGHRPRIDVVVASHRHADHVSGFALKAWADVEVGEVWMPWTEERGNGPADALRKAQHRLAVALARGRTGATAIGWFAINSLSNADAEKTLLTGFLGSPQRRYLPEPDRSKRSFTTPVLPGVTVHALGPSHRPETIAAMDPPEDFFRPLQRAARGASGNGAEASPDLVTPVFGPRFQCSPAEYHARFRELAAHADEKELRKRAETDFFGTATALEDAINGTSLVLVLEFGEHRILLGGDAEWGTWSEILEDEEWRDLLRRTTVYKVSHHGSFNGTPRSFVEKLLPGDATSIVSLQPMKRWPSIPRKTLLKALAEKDRHLVRTDELPPEGGTIVRAHDDLWVELAL